MNLFLRLFEAIQLTPQEMKLLLSMPFEGKMSDGWAVIDLNDCSQELTSIWSKIANGEPLNGKESLFGRYKALSTLDGTTYEIYANRGQRRDGSWEAYFVVSTKPKKTNYSLQPESDDALWKPV